MSERTDDPAPTLAATSPSIRTCLPPSGARAKRAPSFARDAAKVFPGWSLVVALVLLCVSGIHAADTAASAADSTPALKRLLLDAALTGSHVVTVGEHGSIFRSEDNARTWRPAALPAEIDATLTALAFASDSSSGWAVGHDALILATHDGGRSWTKQFQGENINDPFLDVLALDAQRVFAVGAYGSFYQTADGGQTWQRRKLGEDDYHFNRLTRGPTGSLYLAGEHGTLLRSTDHGGNWHPIPAPYEGSFYGVLPLGPRTLVAYGLRGHAFRSEDDGATWMPLAAPEPALLATAIHLKTGPLVFAGQARALFSGRATDGTLAAVPQPPTTAIAELLELSDGHLLAVGEAGATVLEVGRVIPNAPPQETRTPAGAAPSEPSAKAAPSAPPASTTPAAAPAPPAR